MTLVWQRMRSLPSSLRLQSFIRELKPCLEPTDSAIPSASNTPRTTLVCPWFFFVSPSVQMNRRDFSTKHQILRERSPQRQSSVFLFWCKKRTWSSMFARLFLAGLLLVMLSWFFLCGERAIFQRGTQFMHGQPAGPPWQAERDIKCPHLRLHLQSTRAVEHQRHPHRPRQLPTVHSRRTVHEETVQPVAQTWTSMLSQCVFAVPVRRGLLRRVWVQPLNFINKMWPQHQIVKDSAINIMLYSLSSIEWHERTQNALQELFSLLCSVAELGITSFSNSHVAFAMLRTDEVLKQLHPIPTSWRLRPYRTSFGYRPGHKMKRNSRACSKCLCDCETCLSPCLVIHGITSERTLIFKNPWLLLLSIRTKSILCSRLRTLQSNLGLQWAWRSGARSEIVSPLPFVDELLTCWNKSLINWSWESWDLGSSETSCRPGKAINLFDALAGMLPQRIMALLLCELKPPALSR